MFLCSWLELKALANLWDSRRQSASRKSWSEAKNWYIPWSSFCWLPSWPSSGEPPCPQKQTDSFNSFICLSKVYTLSIYQLTNIFLNKTLYQCLSKIYYCHTWAAARFSASSFLLVAGKKTISSMVWISSSCTTHLISRPWKSFWSVDTSVITQQQRFSVFTVKIWQKFLIHVHVHVQHVTHTPD